MVSRKGNFKFFEGEKVLCYEPDPAKTKVLYDSKVLEVSCKKDHVTGRKVAQFLIHFQGWSSTWDRFVTEEFILKDTEDNRRLQKELAEKAQLTASQYSRGFGNLYKKDRKKRPANSYAPRRRNSSTEGNQTDSGATSPSSAPSPTMGVKRPYSTLAYAGSHAPDDPLNSSPSAVNDEPMADDADEAGAVGGGGGASARPPIHFNITSHLLQWFELDQARIKQQKKLVSLPSEPSAVDVLQMWFLDYNQSQIRHMCFHKRGHLRPTAGKKSVATVENIQRCANLCHEVADGLRVFMDHVLSRLLLYNEEREQYDRCIPSEDSEKPVNPPGQEEKPSNHNFTSSSKHDVHKDHSVDDSAVQNEAESRRKTLRSHSGPSTTVTNHPDLSGARSPSTGESLDVKSSGSSLHHAADITALLSNDTMVCGGEHLSLRPMTTQEKDILKKILSRKLVPDNFKEKVVPSVVYGPIHLARCLLKMSDLLANAEYGETQVNLLIDYLNHFMRFLEEHPEWFSDDCYVDAHEFNSRSVHNSSEN